jgi:hypothetical protein
MDQGNIKDYLKRKENQEVNRIELVSCGLVRTMTLTHSSDWYSW